MKQASSKAKQSPGDKKSRVTDAQRLESFGVAALCARISAGESQKSISVSLGVAASSLCEWIAADTERSARVREARIASARHWDEQAEAVLIDADANLPGSIAKARELASHYRWRASKYAPRDYGDKLDITAQVTTQSLTDEQLMERAAALGKKLGMA